MLTNRKKLKNRKRKIKIILASTLFFVFACAILVYFLWTIFLSKAHYISPLPLVLSNSLVKNETNLESLKDELNKEKIEFLSVNSSGPDYIIALKGDKEVVLSSQKSINAQISSLQFILSRLTMEGRRIKTLDIRFDKPVVVFED